MAFLRTILFQCDLKKKHKQTNNKKGKKKKVSLLKDMGYSPWQIKTFAP